MSRAPELNTILGLASPIAQVKADAANAVMRRARNVGHVDTSSSQRMVAVLKEDWQSLRETRGPIIEALAASMGDPNTDLLVVNILSVALATAGEDGVTELAPLLSHEVFWIRAYAAFGIGSLERSARWAVPLLLRALDGAPSDWTGYTIIRALGSIGGRQAATALESMADQQRRLSPPDHHMLQALDEALASVRSQD